jgi:hypothetical protein
MPNTDAVLFLEPSYPLKFLNNEVTSLAIAMGSVKDLLFPMAD